MAKLKNKFPKTEVPRSLEDLQKTYADLVNQLGQVKYQIHVYEEESARLVEQMVLVNHEAAARNELDKKKAEQEKPSEQ